jgi:hypothetical protein
LQPVAQSYALPSPAPLSSEMPASWWTPLLFGKPDDVVGSEDSWLAMVLIEARLAEGKDSGPLVKRDPGANAEAVENLPATVGALHERIYERFGERGWFAFQRLYHEAARLKPRRKIRAANDISNMTPTIAPPLGSDAIEPGLASAIMQAPTRVMRWMLAPPREPPPWRRQEAVGQRAHREMIEDCGAWVGE